MEDKGKNEKENKDLNIRGFINGKEVIINQNNLVKCFFCERFTLPVDFMYQKTIEQLNRFQDIIGEIPRDAAGIIGKKIICNDCKNNLYDLLELDKYAIDYEYD